MALLCKFEPERVLAYLKNIPGWTLNLRHCLDSILTENYTGADMLLQTPVHRNTDTYRLDYCLDVCQQHNVTNALACVLPLHCI